MKKSIALLIMLFSAFTLFARDYDDLVESIKNGDINQFKRLLRSEYSLTETDGYGLQPIHYAASYDKGDIPFLKYLVDRGVDMETPVYLADPDSEYYDFRDYTPQMIACYSGNMDTLRYLVERGADINYKTYSYNTGMDYACMNGHLEIVEYLLPRLENSTVSGAIPHLNWAIMYENPHVAHFLIKVGVDVNSTYDTPAMNELGWHFEPETFLLLLDNGYDLSLTDRWGDNALHEMTMYGRLNALRILLNSGIDINETGDEGKTALHFAAEYGSPGAAQLLVDAGADISVRDSNGLTAGELALQGENILVADIISGKRRISLPAITIEEEIDTGLYLMHRKAENIMLTGLDGRESHLSDYRGKLLFFNIWASWCPPCRSEMPAMQKVYDTLKNRGFEIVAVSVDENARDAEEFADDYDLTFPIFHDPYEENLSINGGQLASEGYPTTVIIDSNGIILFKTVGSRDWSDETYVTVFRKFLQGASPRPPEPPRPGPPMPTPRRP